MKKSQSFTTVGFGHYCVKWNQRDIFFLRNLNTVIKPRNGGLPRDDWYLTRQWLQIEFWWIFFCKPMQDICCSIHQVQVQKMLQSVTLSTCLDLANNQTLYNPLKVSDQTLFNQLQNLQYKIRDKTITQNLRVLGVSQ